MNKKNRQSQIASVKVYIRNYAKKACQLIVPPRITLQQLKQMIETKMKIPASHQMLYWHSQQLQDSKLITFDPLSIVHVINKLRVTISQISIYIKKIGQVSQTFTFCVRAEMKVGEFYDKMIMSVFDEAEDWIMIYVGRRLNPENTFIDQKVEDESQIILVQKNYRINKKQGRQNVGEAVVYDKEQKQDACTHSAKIYTNTQSANMNQPYKNPNQLQSMDREQCLESQKLQKKLTSNQSKQSDSQPKDIESLNKEMKNHQIHTQTQSNNQSQKPQARQSKQHELPGNTQNKQGQNDEYQFTVYDYLAGNNYQKLPSSKKQTIISKGTRSHEFQEIMKKRLEPEKIEDRDISKLDQKAQETVNDLQGTKQEAKLQSYEILKKYQDGFQIRDLHPQRVHKSIRKINVFNPHQCNDQQSIQIEETENQRENEYQSQETNDHLLSSIKKTNSQYHNESIFDQSDQGTSSMNQEDFTFAIGNKNWSTQLQKKQNVKLRTINGGTNLEQWKKISISFTDNDRSDKKMANRILEDSIPVDFDCSTSGFFKEVDEAKKD